MKFIDRLLEPNHSKRPPIKALLVDDWLLESDPMSLSQKGDDKDNGEEIKEGFDQIMEFSEQQKIEKN